MNDEKKEEQSLTRIFIKISEKAPLMLSVNLNNTIKQLKSQIEHKTGFPPAKQKLYLFGGRPLRDDLYLSDYSVHEFSTIRLECHYSDEFDDKVRNARKKFFLENSDEEVPIEPIYHAIKYIDDRYKLIFKPECNYKGCCNKPDIDSELLKGDMYICKKHRIKMANEMKQKCGDNKQLKQIILKLQTYDDKHCHQAGQMEEKKDYFLQNYAKIQQLKFQVAKKLSTIKKRMSPEYWECVVHYHQLEVAAKSLLNFRKISNPFFCFLCLVAVVAICSWIDDCMRDGYDPDDAWQRRQRREREEQRRKEIDDCQNAIEELKKQFFENDKLCTNCTAEIAGIDGKMKKIDTDYQSATKTIKDEIEASTKDVSGLDEEIKKMEQEMEKATATEALELEKRLEQSRDRKYVREQEILKKKKEIQEKNDLAEAKKKELSLKRKEKEKERKRAEKKQDQLNLEKARKVAEHASISTGQDHVSVYIVYDNRQYTDFSCTYGATVMDSWKAYGNYSIFKMEAKDEKGMSHKLVFTTPGRSDAYSHGNPERHKNTRNGNTLTIEL